MAAAVPDALRCVGFPKWLADNLPSCRRQITGFGFAFRSMSGQDGIGVGSTVPD